MSLEQKYDILLEKVTRIETLLTAPPPLEWITYEQAAGILKRSKGFISKQVKQGRIKARKLGTQKTEVSFKSVMQFKENDTFRR